MFLQKVASSFVGAVGVGLVSVCRLVKFFVCQS